MGGERGLGTCPPQVETFQFVYAYREGQNYGDLGMNGTVVGCTLFMSIWFSGGTSAKEDGRELAC